MNITLPFANLFLDEPNMLHRVGVEGTKGLVHVAQFGKDGPAFETPEQLKYYKAWHDRWPWAKPFDTPLWKHGTGNIGSYRMATYWLLDVIERAGSTDPEKIIATFEGDTWTDVNGKVMKMRACDHKVIHDLFVEEYVEPALQKDTYNIPPYHWYEGCSEPGPVYRIPAEKVLPAMDQNLDRCKGKNGWGE